MDPNQTCEFILKQIKESNLNFTLTETPFAVTLNIKKSFIKDKRGSVRHSGFSFANHSASNFQILKKSSPSSIKNTSNIQGDLKASQFKNSSTIPMMNIPAHKPMTTSIVNQSTQKQLKTIITSTPSSLPTTYFSSPASPASTTVLANSITSAMKQDSMSSSRVQKNLQGYSSLSTKLGLNSNTGHVNSFDDNNNPQLFSEPNVTTRNRFKALENLCDDSCAKERICCF